MLKSDRNEDESLYSNNKKMVFLNHPFQIESKKSTELMKYPE